MKESQIIQQRINALEIDLAEARQVLAEVLSDKNVWNRNKMTRWDKFRLKVLNKIL